MVKVSEFISKDRIVIFEKGSEKKEILNKLAEMISKSDNVENKAKFIKDIWERESIMSTGIGLGIAIPHARSKYIKDIVISIGIAKESIEYDALDGKPVDFIVMIAANESQQREYLQVLAKVALILKSNKKREKLLKANNIDEIYEVFKLI
jgi:fructose-specific phosphotransferase system IIA component